MPKAYEHLKVSKEQCVANWSKLHDALNNIWSKPVVDKSGFSINSTIDMKPKAEGKPYKYLKCQHIVECDEWNYNLIFKVICKTFPKAKVWTDGFQINIKY